MDILNRETARITFCKHIVCFNCITTIIATQHKCPICRTELRSAETSLVSAAQDTSDDIEDSNSLANMSESSSKLDALFQILDGTRTTFSIFING